MKLLWGLFTHKLCRRKQEVGNKEEKEYNWRMRSVKKKARGRRGEEGGGRGMRQQPIESSLCHIIIPTDGSRTPPRLSKQKDNTH